MFIGLKKINYCLLWTKRSLLLVAFQREKSEDDEKADEKKEKKRRDDGEMSMMIGVSWQTLSWLQKKHRCARWRRHNSNTTSRLAQVVVKEKQLAIVAIATGRGQLNFNWLLK